MQTYYLLPCFEWECPHQTRTFGYLVHSCWWWSCWRITSRETGFDVSKPHIITRTLWFVLAVKPAARLSLCHRNPLEPDTQINTSFSKCPGHGVYVFITAGERKLIHLLNTKWGKRRSKDRQTYLLPTNPGAFLTWLIWDAIIAHSPSHPESHRPLCQPSFMLKLCLHVCLIFFKKQLFLGWAGWRVCCPGTKKAKLMF